MGFSEFLNSRRATAKELVACLRKHYAYASVLGVDVKARSVRVDRNTSGISDRTIQITMAQLSNFFIQIPPSQFSDSLLYHPPC